MREFELALCRVLGQVDAGEVAADNERHEVAKPVPHAPGDAVASLVRRKQRIGLEVHLDATHTQKESVRVNPLAARALGSRRRAQHTPRNSDHCRGGETNSGC